jgi:hypothetical protein
MTKDGILGPVKKNGNQALGGFGGCLYAVYCVSEPVEIHAGIETEEYENKPQSMGK